MASRRSAGCIASVVVLAAGLGTFLAAPASAAPFTSPDGQWTWSRPLPHGYVAGAIAAPAPGALFVATWERAALVTRNGGTSWSWDPSASAVPGFAGLAGILFVSAQQGWAWGTDSTGKKGMLLHTADGAVTWQPSLTVSGRSSFGPVRFAGALSGWVLAHTPDHEDYVLYTTADGGQTWSSAVALPKDDSTTFATLAPQGGQRAVLMETVWSAGASSGDVVGTRVWHTTDGGATWSAPTVLKGTWIRDAAFSSGDRGWAIEDGNRVWGTTDGGASWQKVHQAPAGWNFLDVTTVGNDVWAVGDGGALHSVNNGRSWRTLPGIAGAQISFSNPQDGWIVYVAHYLHTGDGGRTWTVVAPGNPTAVSELAAVPGGTVWGTGNGYIVKSPDAGAHWKHVTRPRGLAAVAAVSARQAWAVGKRGRVVHTADGGRHWTTQLSGVTMNLGAVCFVDTKHGWAGGSDGTLLRTVDGGRHWTKRHSALGAAIRVLVFADAKHGMALANQLRPGILCTADGGRSWSTTKLPVSSHQATAVVMTDAARALVIACDFNTTHLSHSWSTSDGGKTWQQGTDLPNRDYYVTIARSGTRLCAVGTDGSVVTSSDDGATWSYDGTPAGGEVFGAQFVGTTTLMIGGQFGIMTRDLIAAPLP